MYKEDDPNKHCLKVFTLNTARHYKTFVTKLQPIEHKFDKPIVDFCFNQDNSTFYICLSDNKILIRQAAKINEAG